MPTGPTTEPGRPRKRFGQHFLEPVWARKVVEALDARPTDTFLEIGPGRGALTRPLARLAGAVVACEIDRDLAASLTREGITGVQVMQADFLGLEVGALVSALEAGGKHRTTELRVAGNLPYNIASPIMFKLVDLTRRGVALRDATIMIQREVADRLLAAPGTKDYGILTVLIRHRASVTRLLNLPPGAFRPAPKVRSTVVRLSFHQPKPPVRDEAMLAAVVGAIFARRRKTLSNALAGFHGLTSAGASEILAQVGISSVRRPETLSIEEVVKVADRLSDRVSPVERGSPTTPVL